MRSDPCFARVPLALVLTVSAALAVAATRPTAAATPAAPAAPAHAEPGLRPGTPGYRLPWNRPTRDTVVDLAPGERADRFEFHGRLLAADDAPLAGALVYVYHADSHGEYGSREFPTIPSMAGCVRSGPGGGFIVRTRMPGMYEGPPHIHIEASFPGRGRCTWFLNLWPDSASWPLPGTMSLEPARPSTGASEHKALVHLDPDGVYRAHRRMHVESWFAQPGLDSLHAVAEKRYERAPWRAADPTHR